MQTNNSCKNVNGRAMDTHEKSYKVYIFWYLFKETFVFFKDEIISKKFDFQMNIHKKWLHEKTNNMF